MPDPSLAVQGALVAQLKALETEASARVYDLPPNDPVHPYITVGPGQTVPVDETCWDASEVFVQIDVWSVEVGYPEVKRIAGALRDALHDQPFVVPDHVCDRVEVRSVTYSRERDGITSRARIELLFTTQPD